MNYSINDVIKTILENESDFLAQNGFFDGEFIMERFDLDLHQWRMVRKGLES